MTSDRFDTQATFTAAIKRCGGVPLDEVLTAPDFENADYYFPDANTVIELKCLTNNGFADQNYRSWLEARYDDWVRRGLAPWRKPPFTFDLQQLPRACHDEVVQKMVTKLKRNICRKANRQIRETRHHLGMPNAHGVLAIANDGDLSFPPIYLQKALGRVLTGANFPCITEVYHFTANTSLARDNEVDEGHLWVNWLVRGRSRSPAELMLAIRDAWKLEHDRKLGGESRTINIAKTMDLDGFRLKQRGGNGPAS